MNLDVEGSSRLLPTLVQLCQRVAAANIDSISSLGEDLPYQLVKPILERCDASQLIRFEESSPHLKEDTQEIWKQKCYSVFSLIIGKELGQPSEEPDCWRMFYGHLQGLEAKRLENASNRLRNQRNIQEERKREREVKLTDRVPPPKKARWGSSQPKSLFQKTRSEASRQKSMYTARMVPPMINGKTYRVLPKAPDLSMSSSPDSISKSRVTVNTVLQRRPETKVAPLAFPRPPNTAPLDNVDMALEGTQMSPTPKPPFEKPPPESKLTPPSRPKAPPVPGKRDKMACLFVPKHRAHSQRT